MRESPGMTLFAKSADDERVTSRRISMTDLNKRTVRKTEHYLLLIILMTIPYEI